MANSKFPWVPVIAITAGGVAIVWMVVAFTRPAVAGELESGTPPPLPLPPRSTPRTPATTTPPRPSTPTPTPTPTTPAVTTSTPPRTTISRTVPPFVPVTFTENGHTVTLSVAADYLAPMRVTEAQRIADAHNAILPTRKMVDKIYQAATLKLPFHPMDPAEEHVARDSDEMIRRFLAKIERDRAGRAGLAAGHLKDYVLSNTVRPGKMVIYGAWYADGRRVQPLSGPWHDVGYFDYSQGPRLVSRQVVIDGQVRNTEDVLRDSTLARLLSDEGVIRSTRYPT